MITIFDLAKECDCSIATISRAFSSNGRISDKTRSKILAKAREIGYVPNAVAQSLQNKKSKYIGIIIPEISNSFYFSVLQNMEARYRENGYRFIIGFYQNGISDERDIIESMASCRVDALIFSPFDCSSSETLKRCFPDGNVLQLFTSHYEEYPSLVMDDILGVSLAVEHLCKKGKKRILYYGDSVRVDGFTEMMDKNNLNWDGLCYTDEPISVENAERAIIACSPDSIIAIAKRSESIIAALDHLGLRYPDDLSLVVYDDVDWTKMLNITVISHPLDEIAEKSVGIILNGLENGFKSEKYVIKPFVKERGSVR